jgi:hypothetical protein
MNFWMNVKDALRFPMPADALFAFLLSQSQLELPMMVSLSSVVLEHHCFFGMYRARF